MPWTTTAKVRLKSSIGLGARVRATTVLTTAVEQAYAKGYFVASNRYELSCPRYFASATPYKLRLPVSFPAVSLDVGYQPERAFTPSFARIFHRCASIRTHGRGSVLGIYSARGLRTELLDIFAFASIRILNPSSMESNPPVPGQSQPRQQPAYDPTNNGHYGMIPSACSLRQRSLQCTELWAQCCPINTQTMADTHI